MRIVMTGATSGFGRVAAQHLNAQGHDLTIAARSRPALANATYHPLDLGALADVRRFAKSLADAPPIDVLILNAGLQLNAFETSKDGFERTFAVNHLAHYLLVRLLLPTMAHGGRIVITGSGTHDPTKKTGIPAPRHADAMMLAYPDRDPRRDANAGTAGRRAYSSSKLANIMTARELAARTSTDRPDLSILSFDPGFVPGTGLARDYGAVADFLFKSVLPLLIRFGRNVSTMPISGKALADLATDPALGGERGTYWSMQNRKPERIAASELARDDAACAKLWDESAVLVGF